MQQRRVAPSTLEAVLERITYANQETGYTVARVATDRGSDLLTVVGPLLGAQPGESLRLRGRWASHPQYGRQFQVEAYTTVLPATIQGIRRYLGSGLIRGIGPKMAERIVDHFGQDTLRLVEEAPGRLVEVPGLGPKRTAMIMTAWAEQQAIKEVMVFLQGVGVSTSLAVRIYKTYRDEAIQVVRREPYRLAAEVWGIGFKTADQLARRLGIPHDSPQRVKAGLQFALSQASEDGHCYLLEAELVANATGCLAWIRRLPAAALRSWWLRRAWSPSRSPPLSHRMPRRARAGRSGWSRSAVPRSPWPVGCCACSTPRRPAGQPPDGRLDGRAGLAGSHHGRHPGPEQEAAVRLALTERVAVLTGGPGCGKSYTVRAVVALARAKRAKILLARRPGGPPSACPSWPGWRRPPCTGCCSCARVGMPPLTATVPWAPTWWWTRPPCWMCWWPTSSSRPSPWGAAAAGRRRRPAPQRRRRGGAAGFAGRRAAAPGPAHPGVPPGPAEWGGRQRPSHQRRAAAGHPWPFRNDYDKGTAGVFNGSVGQVTALSLEDSELRVLLDEDEEVGYGFDELDELTHAYAVSIHRSQGSEYPCVVVALTMSAWLMLQRNLLYTAVTRAKQLVVLVGSRRALARAVRTQGAGRRYTALTQRLQLEPGRAGAG
jgi:hypothetical protein